MGGEMKYGVIFFMYGGGQVFFKGETREVSLVHIKKYLDSLKKMEGTSQEAFLYGDDEEGNHVSMVRCGQVVGYTLIEMEEKESWR